MTNRELRRAAILALMSDRNVWTCAKLALHTDVSPRTIYRDMAALSAKGRVRGEVSVGYVLKGEAL